MAAYTGNATRLHTGLYVGQAEGKSDETIDGAMDPTSVGEIVTEASWDFVSVEMYIISTS